MKFRSIPTFTTMVGLILPAVFTVILLTRVISNHGIGSGGGGGGGTHGSGAKFTGRAVESVYGPVRAIITVASGRITAVDIAAPHDSPNADLIDQQAIPILTRETLQAQSARIHSVSGATQLSQAYAGSLTDALRQANI